jgi:hypothetical protein
MVKARITSCTRFDLVSRQNTPWGNRDSVISADPSTDQLLFDIVPETWCMDHAVIWIDYRPAWQMENVQRVFLKTSPMTGSINADGYPKFRRRNTDNGRQSSLNIYNTDIDIDNRCVVPYLPLLRKIFKAHISVEFCSSLKPIKYICKCMNKGSDMAF